MPLFRRTRNLYRRIRSKSIGFVYLTLSGELPMFFEPKSYLEKKLFPDPPISFYDLYYNSQRLIDDKRVKGMIIQISSIKASAAMICSIRDLIKKWKANDKVVWVYAHQFNFLTYFLASAADKIIVPQTSSIYATGVKLGTLFFKSYLEEKGIKAQVVQVTPYKSAANSLIHDEMPPEQEEALNWLADTYYDFAIECIAKGRNKTIDQVTKFIDNNPYKDDKALAEGWIDGIADSSEVINLVKEEFGKVAVTKYQDSLKRLGIEKKKANIAVIPVIGMIVDGEGRKRNTPIPLFGERSSGDLTVVDQIREIRRQKKKYKGAILYVDSGGGSAVSSEAMLSELGQLAKEMPLITYFDGVAASGGYYVAMNSQKIIAQPLTITSSIGVLNLKISADGMYKQRNVNRKFVNRGKNIDITGNSGEWNEEQYKLMQDHISRVYDVFLSHVSKNRNIPIEEVEKIAGGRVWLGKQAKDLNLIDQLGGIDVAIDELTNLVKIGKPRLEIPRVKSKFIIPNPYDQVTIFQQLNEEISNLSGKNLLMSNIIIKFH